MKVACIIQSFSIFLDTFNQEKNKIYKQISQHQNDNLIRNCFFLSIQTHIYNRSLYYHIKGLSRCFFCGLQYTML